MSLRLIPDDEPQVREDPSTFYMVWTKTGHVPRKTHDSYQDAATEAARLAKQNQGKKYVVLKAVAKFYVQPKLTPPVTEPAHT